MATITLIADTNYSALTVANGDTIDCAGFVLTLDVAPTQTGVQVTTPGTAGTVVFSGGWNLSTWDFFAGAGTTAGVIGTLPVDATIKSITGGAGANARGIATNNGTIATVAAGTGGGAHGININNGVITTVTGSVSAANTMGILTNNGKVVTTTGGGVSGANGIQNNNGTVTAAIGGTHASARGIGVNNGLCLRLTDDVGAAISIWNGDTAFVEGPHVAGVIPGNIKTIYSFGTLSASATIAADATVTTLSEGAGGAAFKLVGGGGLVY